MKKYIKAEKMGAPNINSYVFNALSEVAYELTKAGYEYDRPEFQKAIDNFMRIFFPDDIVKEIESAEDIEDVKVDINIDWDKFLDYFGVDYNDLMSNENEYADYDVENYLGLAAEAIQEEESAISLQDFVDKVVEYATDIEHIADYAAGQGVSDAGLLIGIEENPQTILDVCKAYYGG